jgi:hypothetical protein
VIGRGAAVISGRDLTPGRWLFADSGRPGPATAALWNTEGPFTFDGARLTDKNGDDFGAWVYYSFTEAPPINTVGRV